MKQFLIILKGKGALDYSEREFRKRIDEYNLWLKEIKPHYVEDDRLEREGRHIVGKNQIYTDGPFLEAKEIIGGFIRLQAASINEAEKIALTCPLLKYFEFYLRPVAIN